jgi:hypothetical protein
MSVRDQYKYDIEAIFKSGGGMKDRIESVMHLIEEVWAKEHGLYDYYQLIHEWIDVHDLDYVTYLDLRRGPLKGRINDLNFGEVLKVTVNKLISDGYLVPTSKPHRFKAEVVKQDLDWTPIGI